MWKTTMSLTKPRVRRLELPRPLPILLTNIPARLVLPVLLEYLARPAIMLAVVAVVAALTTPAQAQHVNATSALPARPTRAVSALQPAQIGVVANVDDPASVEVARYYLHARDVPEENLI